MPARNELFTRMARDVGIQRYRGETDDSFFARIAYTGSRYWVSAFCMDDGAGCVEGLSKQALNRRLKSLINLLSKAWPFLADWFEIDQGGVSSVYSRLIDIGEIVPNGFSNRYLAQPPRLLPVFGGYALIIGMTDPTVKAGSILGYDRSSIIASGLTSLVASDVELPGRTPQWWEAEWELLPWISASKYENVEYVSPKASGWGLGNAEAWSPVAMLTEGIGLARIGASDRNTTTYCAVRRGTREPFLCAIEQTKALELYYLIRKKAGNPVTACLKRLDNSHVKIVMPLGLIPGEYDRVLGVIGWPVSGITDRFTRIARVDCVSLVGELLAKCNVDLREI